MSYSSIFPQLPGQGWPFTRTPIWKTGIQTTQSGRELRASFMSAPLYKWSASYEVLRTAASLTEFQNLMGFFNSRSGSFDFFMFQDPDDYTVPVASPQTIGTGDGSTKVFQLVKSFGGFTEPVLCPISGTFAIYDNGTIVSSGVSVDTTTGLVTFTTAPVSGHVITWTGNYYYKCRFLADTCDFDRFMTGLYSMSKLEFQSLKL